MHESHDQKNQDNQKLSLIPQEILQLGSEDERNCGFWNQEEQLNYIIFIDFYKEDLQSKQKRKFNKIFKAMSEFIKTRDAIQCRSHHMKQLRTLKKIRNIIKESKRKIGEPQYRQIYEKITSDRQIFKTMDSRSMVKKQPTKTVSNTKSIGIQTIEETNCKVQGEKNEEFMSSTSIPLIQSNFVVYPMWNLNQTGTFFNMNS